MSTIIVQGAASAYLVFIGTLMDASSNWQSKFIFKFLPVAIGVLLGFHAYAQFMGWQ